MWHTLFLVVAHGLLIAEGGLSCPVACGILVPRPKSKPVSLALKEDS